ncbi:hypothetical protein M0R88_17485 [Halorussus gelatinilyticus]|uniref:Uncharacterized protein n=1 Tax=Halorussus gelatinilyticus TaxID=2937524 RepID=A0A8U0IHH0_9EURY|nr:hypothetical protein [Halorussus gelatinilyticus]UPW00288.1 hypothetical protein M0R88_17485 [Halorussus gelatinilyticus]
MSEWSSHLRLAVALALVASPFWLLPDVGATTYEYQAEEVEYSEYVTGTLYADDQIEGLACDNFDDFGEQCVLAARVAQNGPVVVNQSAIFSRAYRFDTEYVIVEDSGTGKPFYRWRINRTERPDDRYRVTYALETVTPPEILRNISVAPGDLSEKARRALDGETVRTRGERLDAAQRVVRANGTYYYLSEEENPRGGPKEWQVLAGQVVAVAVGLGLLRGRWLRER